MSVARFFFGERNHADVSHWVRRESQAGEGGNGNGRANKQAGMGCPGRSLKESTMKKNPLLWAVLIYLYLAGNSFGAFVDFRTPPFDTCTTSPATSCTRTVGGVQITIEGWTDVNSDNALNPNGGH